ncbi:hypothetical protein P171DRAFT_27841 [Karstenula rhodostoma CBS 690.94]|uniref:Uncharacterized protein n=1 Tax=Karstenula rhodostoma CBS 690.94 TaxID=1392251 RepID=A0A9P4PFP8_9PLEO|nr:hypothetical protein P171DRAFT_27841 [Karstenula rhodostoma CBS 690.94]
MRPLLPSTRVEGFSVRTMPTFPGSIPTFPDSIPTFPDCHQSPMPTKTSRHPQRAMPSHTVMYAYLHPTGRYATRLKHPSRRHEPQWEWERQRQRQWRMGVSAQMTTLAETRVHVFELVVSGQSARVNFYWQSSVPSQRRGVPLCPVVSFPRGIVPVCTASGTVQ